MDDGSESAPANDKIVVINRYRQTNTDINRTEVIALAADSDPNVRCQAILALGSRREVNQLGVIAERLLNDPSPRVRGVSAVALGFIKTEDSFTYLREALADTSDFVVGNVLASFGMHRDKRAVPEVIPFLKDSSFNVRLAACVLLIELGHVTVDVLDALDHMRHSAEGIDQNRSLAEVEPIVEMHMAAAGSEMSMEGSVETIDELYDRAYMLKYG